MATLNTPIPAGRPAFLSLPPELFMLIGTFLSKTDAVNASLACVELYYLFRPTVWEVICARGNDLEMNNKLLYLLGKARSELKALEQGTLPGRLFLHEIKTLRLRLEPRNFPLVQGQSRPVDLGDKIYSFLSQTIHLKNLTIDLRHLDFDQVARFAALLSAKRSDFLPHLNKLRLISSEYDDSSKCKRSPVSMMVSQHVIAASFCQAPGPQVTEFELIRGCDSLNDCLLRAAMAAFEKRKATYGCSLKRFLIGKDSAKPFEGVSRLFRPRQVLEEVIQKDHKDSIEWFVMLNYYDYWPVGSYEAWNTAQDAITCLTESLSGMPRLSRVAFPLMDFPVLARSELDDSGVPRINVLSAENFELEAVDEAMEYITRAVMEGVPQLEHVAFWSLAQERGVEAVREGEEIHLEFHDVEDDWWMPRPREEEQWPMGIWGYKF